MSAKATSPDDNAIELAATFPIEGALTLDVEHGPFFAACNDPYWFGFVVGDSTFHRAYYAIIDQFPIPDRFDVFVYLKGEAKSEDYGVAYLIEMHSVEELKVTEYPIVTPYGEECEIGTPIPTRP